MHLIETALAYCAQFCIWVISSTGYAGVAILMAIESACIPLPSEIIMPFAGYLVSTGEMTLFWAATAGAIGCNIGSIPAYEIGRRGGRVAVERFGRYLFLNMHDLDRAEGFFNRFGGLAVLICRMLPLVRSFIAFPAGMARMKLVPFHVYTFVGSWPFCWALAWIGMKLGQAWNSDPRIKQWFHRIDFVLAALIAVGIVAIVVHKVRARRSRG